MPYLKKKLWFYALLSNLYITKSHSADLQTHYNYSGYQLSKECLSCMESDDFVKKDQTFSEQEAACLKKELSKFQIRANATLNIVISNIDVYSKRKDIPEDQKQRLQGKIKYLQKSSVLFSDFIEKFCHDNSRHLYGSRYASFAYHSQFLDFLNTRLYHLEQFFSYGSPDNDDLNILFTNLIERILKKSKNNLKLTDLENQEIDIFLRLSNFLTNPTFNAKYRNFFLEKLKYLYIHENNSIADALYKKFKAFL